MMQTTDFVDELNTLFDRMQYRVQTLAHIVCDYTNGCLDIDDITKVTCMGTAQDGEVKHNFDVFITNRLYIKYNEDELCYDFWYGKKDSFESVNLKDILSLEMDYVLIIDILEKYIKEHILHEPVDDVE
jgi:hypothetical protein